MDADAAHRLCAQEQPATLSVLGTVYRDVLVVHVNEYWRMATLRIPGRHDEPERHLTVSLGGIEPVPSATGTSP